MVEQQIYQDQTKPEVGGEVLRTFSSSAPSRQTGLQTRITEEIVFHVSLLEQDTTRKGRVDENATELDAGEDSGEYEVEAIRDSAVYARESAGHLPGLYYLVSWKGYPEEENTWEPYSAVQHLRKLISSFYNDYSDKSTAISKVIDTALPMARPTIKPAAKPMVKLTKRKQG